MGRPLADRKGLLLGFYQRNMQRQSEGRAEVTALTGCFYHQLLAFVVILVNHHFRRDLAEPGIQFFA